MHKANKMFRSDSLRVHQTQTTLIARRLSPTTQKTSRGRPLDGLVVRLGRQHGGQLSTRVHGYFSWHWRVFSLHHRRCVFLDSGIF